MGDDIYANRRGLKVTLLLELLIPGVWRCIRCVQSVRGLARRPTSPKF
jgi:hypothetical protein